MFFGSVREELRNRWCRVVTLAPTKSADQPLSNCHLCSSELKSLIRRVSVSIFQSNIGVALEGKHALSPVTFGSGSKLFGHETCRSLSHSQIQLRCTEVNKHISPFSCVVCALGLCVLCVCAWASCLCSGFTCASLIWLCVLGLGVLGCVCVWAWCVLARCSLSWVCVEGLGVLGCVCAWAGCARGLGVCWPGVLQLCVYSRLGAWCVSAGCGWAGCAWADVFLSWGVLLLGVLAAQKGSFTWDHHVGTLWVQGAPALPKMQGFASV